MDKDSNAVLKRVVQKPQNYYWKLYVKWNYLILSFEMRYFMNLCLKGHLAIKVPNWNIPKNRFYEIIVNGSSIESQSDKDMALQCFYHQRLPFHCIEARVSFYIDLHICILWIFFLTYMSFSLNRSFNLAMESLLNKLLLQ